MIVRFVGGPWDGREELHEDRPAFVIKSDLPLLAIEDLEAGEVYLYHDAGTAPDGAVLVELAPR